MSLARTDNTESLAHTHKGRAFQPQSPKEKFQVRKLQKHKTERVPTSASPETAQDSLWFRYGKAKNLWFFPYVQNETAFKIKGVTRTTSRVTHYTITHTTKNTNADAKIKNCNENTFLVPIPPFKSLIKRDCAKLQISRSSTY